VNRLELTGRTRTHVVATTDPACTLHVHAVTPFAGLRRAARAAGIDLRAASSFRDFDRQLAIWNGKYSGTRALLDAAGRPLDPSLLSPEERLDAILRWSALPGASRHHWGTDVDFIDANAIKPGIQVQLIAAEYAPTGPFGPLLEWLCELAPRFGFFRPYRGELSGAQAEAWHWSFAPLAEGARRQLTPAVLEEALAAAPILGKEFVLARLDELHARYVAAIDWP
jgi:LAS superfamily LD-carboxypeptidase LdcB